MKLLFGIFVQLTCFYSLAQSTIDLTDQTIKIGGLSEEVLYFGFYEGDQIILNFSEVDGKELKEVEVLEYPETSKYSDFKVSKIENKVLSVSRKSVYKFRFSNGAVSGRVCKIKIQRIPTNEQTRNYNSAVSWLTKQDTTWNNYTKDVLVGYDTTYRQVVKKELINTETTEELLIDKSQRVHSEYNSSGNKSSVFFTLPQASEDSYETSKVIAWAYWVGVGQEGEEAWEQNIAQLAEGAAALYFSPLGAYAIGAAVSLLMPRTGDDVYYAVCDKLNRDLFLNGQEFSVWDQGKGLGGYKKFVSASLCEGSFYIVLSNDNMMDPIDVSVKVSAIIETKYYEDKNYTEEHVKARYEKKIFSDPVIHSKVEPVF